MASKERIERLQQLVAQAGNSRKAEQLIKNAVGVAPTHSAIYKAMQLNSKTTDYVVQCYIRDLEFALSTRNTI
ncbi:hypothetical protein ETN89_19815 (plasmid) [Photobacterium damselae subsp. damselae]|uniref:hypothetical protein n=1 Tax=Photobacterium damselae TaxID=38293 RepID=UPI000A2FBAC3|nr:hypothetical protein [Photobacterium damselae]ARR51932.1 hypothetical protein CAY62_21270 [Photobacterium damselae subsp. damselae]QAY37515.1 hypothetical protein ETN89_19815 [Photobacterium damselae subsp. damselae]